MQMGNIVVLEGAALGIGLSGVVAALNFVAHQHLPYKKMLIVTGVLLTVVLVVMVGEQAQEMQLAGWLPTTAIRALDWIPAWMGTWWSVFPTVETLAAQAMAVILVLGSYVLARYQTAWLPRHRVEVAAMPPAAPPVSAV
jgi:high-affinity iron transporter